MSDTKRFQIWIPTAIALALAGGVLIGTRIDNAGIPLVSVQSATEDAPVVHLGEGRLEELLRYVDARYVDDIKREELTEQAIATILQELDPHSNYIPARDLETINDQLDGNFDGIGVEFLLLDDTVTVVTPLSGGPSETVGILAGDKIVKIEDTLVAGVEMPVDKIVGRLRGERGTEIQVSIARQQEDKLRDFTIVRDKIPLHSVDIAYMLTEDIGYIKLNRFSATTYEEFMRGLERLIEEKDMKNLVIDLRYNPGGYLQQAVNMLSQLFKQAGDLLVYTEGRTVKRTDYKTTGRNFFDVNDIVVLIDEGSASASEIVAGAIQDLDRGTVIGRRSFGKGLVQEQYSLRDGSALRLTVARYYTPSGRSIQKSYEDRTAYERDVLNRFENGELSEAEKNKQLDSLQLHQYRTKKGRTVYGGGGITPDIFVPLDTFQLNDTYIKLRQYVPQFVFRYLENNKPAHSDELYSFTYRPLSEETITAFMDYAASRDESITRADFDVADAQLTRFLKARLARQLFGEEGFYTIWNEEDKVVQKALEVLEEKKTAALIRKNKRKK